MRSIRVCSILIILSIVLGGCAGKENKPQESPSVMITPEPFVKTNHEPKATGFIYDENNLDYQLVWSDEFDYEGLPDDTKWGYDTGGHGWGNNELQYYTEGDNVRVTDGKLIIEARKEKHGEMDYTSTRLISKGKGDWLTGKLKFRYAAQAGTWPAIWMLPQTGNMVIGLPER